MMDDIREYHNRTKHFPGKYARSLGYMDWENQPNPFRFYLDTQTFELPFKEEESSVEESSAEESSADFDSIFNPNSHKTQEISLKSIGSLLELSLGLSAWKSFNNSSWALRMNPSSGNLHPTEAHLILPEMEGLKSGVYHYDPFHHQLELRRPAPADLIKVNGFFLILSSIFWRESWKYGERAFRYCHMDAGHAIAGLGFAAGLCGWKSQYMNGMSDQALLDLGGLASASDAEAEHPDLMLFIHYDGSNKPFTMGPDTVEVFRNLQVLGTPNQLSKKRMGWPIIEEAAKACEKPDTETQAIELKESSFLFNASFSLSPEQAIRQRRSSQAFDFEGSMDRESFFTLLDRTLPRADRAPFDIHLSPPAIHLVSFVHRVDGIRPGLYILVRREEHLKELKHRFDPNFIWEQVQEDFPFYALKYGDLQDKARGVSCFQDIAAHGCFAMAMLGLFDPMVKDTPHEYRTLHWEAGMVGQVLYLCAEALGYRGTGIGCFFDNLVHDQLGLEDSYFQSIYHFTVGKSLEDKRVKTFHPYSHLKRK